MTDTISYPSRLECSAINLAFANDERLGITSPEEWERLRVGLCLWLWWPKRRYV